MTGRKHYKGFTGILWRLKERVSSVKFVLRCLLLVVVHVRVRVCVLMYVRTDTCKGRKEGREKERIKVSMKQGQLRDGVKKI